MSYEKHTWQTGEIITADKLNNMEDGIEKSGIHWINAAMDLDTGLYTLDVSYTDLKKAFDAVELVAYKNAKDESYYGYNQIFFLTDLSFETDTPKYSAVFASASMETETTPPKMIIAGKVFEASTATSLLTEIIK